MMNSSSYNLNLNDLDRSGFRRYRLLLSESIPQQLGEKQNVIFV